MENPAISLADIAGLVGFMDQSYFTRVFKKHTGTSPNRYRMSAARKGARTSGPTATRPLDAT
jgi:YesN/AraC family two-component response regulator